MILIMETPKKGTPNFGKPPYRPQICRGQRPGALGRLDPGSEVNPPVGTVRGDRLGFVSFRGGRGGSAVRQSLRGRNLIPLGGVFWNGLAVLYPCQGGPALAVNSQYVF